MRAPILSAACLCALAAAGLAAAETAPSDDVIHACMRKTTGALRIVRHTPRCTRREAPVTWNQRGPAGADGANGTAGAPGADGAAGHDGASGHDGAPGADAAGPLMVRVHEQAVTEGETRTKFAPVVGFYPAGGLFDSEDEVFLIAPAVATAGRSLAVSSPQADIGTRSVTLVINGVPSALGCTIASGAKSCTTTGPVTIPAAAHLSLKIVHVHGTGSGVFNGDLMIAWRDTV